jgi:hypothetical protein
MNLTEMFTNAALSAVKDEPHPMDPLAQAMELRARFRDVYGDVMSLPGAHERPIVGSLVKGKRGLSRYKGDPVLIVWRMLDDDNWQDVELVTDYIKRHFCGERMDCITGYLNDGGNTVVLEPHALRLLDVYPEPV